MSVFFNILVFLHIIGWAIVLGGYLSSMRSPGLYRGVFHGAATAAVAGAVMLALIESGAHKADYLDHNALRVKFAIALVIAVLAFFARRQGAKADNGTGPVAPGLKHAIGALTLVNVVIAVFWM